MRAKGGWGAMLEPESSAPRSAAINVMQMAQGCNDASRGKRAPSMRPRDYVEIILWSGRSPWLRVAADGRFLQSLRCEPPKVQAACNASLFTSGRTERCRVAIANNPSRLRSEARSATMSVVRERHARRFQRYQDA